MIKTLSTGGDSAKRRLYQKFWAGVLYKGAIMTVLSNFLLAGGDWDDFAENYSTAWEAGNLRWMATDITPIYKLFGSDTKERHYFTPIGHFKDVFKFIRYPFRSMIGKGSVLGRMFLSAALGQDWAGRRYTEFSELLGIDDKGIYKTSRKGKYTKGDPKGGKLAGSTVTWGGRSGPVGPSQLPSYALSSARGVLPVQFQNFISFISGEMNGISAILNSLGFGVTQTYNLGKKQEKAEVAAAKASSSSSDSKGRKLRSTRKGSGRKLRSLR